MQVLVCDGTWSVASGSPVCNGTLLAAPTNAIPGNGITIEEAQTLKDGALVLFVAVFCVLALKKVLP
jgi:predicted RecA/RadA family phage recombinase